MGSSNLFADFSSYQSVLLAAVVYLIFCWQLQLQLQICCCTFDTFCLGICKKSVLRILFHDNLEINYKNRNNFQNVTSPVFFFLAGNVMTFQHHSKPTGGLSLEIRSTFSTHTHTFFVCCKNVFNS